MTIKNRREREKEEMKELILKAANDIVTTKGFEKVSIRKIAKEIEYSPSIIYHYFKDKEEILNTIMKRGYKKIVEAVSSIDLEENSPKERLIQMTKNYIEAALSMPDEFMAAQLNQSAQSLKYTSSLFKGASKEKPALRALFKILKEIYKEKNKNINEDTIELTAQMIAVSTLGLIIKLIVEENIDEDQRQRLIDCFINNTVLNIANINN